MNIKKAILHVMDAQQETYIMSETELFVNLPLSEYFMKHLSKIQDNPNGQKGKLQKEHNMYTKMQQYEQKNFIQLSQTIGKQILQAYQEALRWEAMNVFFVEYEQDNRLFFAMLKCGNKEGFIREISETGNEIIQNFTLLPNGSQAMDEFFIIDIENKSVFFKEVKKYFDGRETLLISEDVLGCTSLPSTKQSLKDIDEIVMQASRECESNPLTQTLKMKQFLKSCVQSDQKVDVKDLVEVVYPKEEKFQSTLQNLIEERALPETIQLQKKAPIAMRKHKIKTDSGIEISVPLELLEAQDVVQINNNSDGSVSISLQHIGKLID